jgi:hypothetical protein
LQKENEFQQKLKDRFETLQTDTEVDEMANNLTKTIKECALETAGKSGKRKEEKLKPETKELLKERRKLASKHSTPEKQSNTPKPARPSGRK